METRTDLTPAVWRMSTYTGSTGNCIEVARNLPGLVAVRDSKDRSGPTLAVTPDAWQSLLDSIRNGQLSL